MFDYESVKMDLFNFCRIGGQEKSCFRFPNLRFIIHQKLKNFQENAKKNEPRQKIFD